eukprot:12932698-Prorocentrum_lima.AAC.1
MDDALTVVLRHHEGLQQASEYFGLPNSSGAWILPESARRHVCSCIIAFLVLPTAPRTSPVALARVSARANDHGQASLALKA